MDFHEKPKICLRDALNQIERILDNVIDEKENTHASSKGQAALYRCKSRDEFEKQPIKKTRNNEAEMKKRLEEKME